MGEIEFSCRRKWKATRRVVKANETQLNCNRIRGIKTIQGDILMHILLYAPFLLILFFYQLLVVAFNWVRGKINV
jgi:hypothetical protein